MRDMLIIADVVVIVVARSVIRFAIIIIWFALVFVFIDFFCL